MSYDVHFKHADDVIEHLDTFVPGLEDPLLRAKYVGFVTVAAVTVYEIALKSVLIDFATSQNKVFGTFAEAFFGRINGRIRIEDIQKDYLKKFGVDYKTGFKENLKQAADVYLHAHKRDIVSSYENLITWRNDYAHEGTLNETATYEEVVQAYADGKEVIRCLAGTMK